MIRQVHPWRLGSLLGSFARGHLHFVTGLAAIGAAAGEAADGEGFKEPCCPAAEWPSASERSDAVSDHFAAAAAVQSWTLQTCGQADVTDRKSVV